ncbi:MAG: carbon-nitrogen hydrolase family protein [Myxococcales bacterium]|nr:carbon-nitrogen hydrolase family protein [Myxococcales bacterium]
MQYRAAVIQTRTTSDAESSVAQALRSIRVAAKAGASLITLPETVAFIGPEETKVSSAESIDGPTFQKFRALAAELGIHLLVGSLAERSLDPSRPYNTSVLYGPSGETLAVYRKIHLFDVDLRPNGPRLMESERTLPGESVAVVKTELGTIGLTICYDIRFPELFGELTLRGAEIICVPAAFTVPTGRDHWEPLLRARAIENQCYVVAPAQWGQHWEHRRSYGRSMIVDPWGVTIAQCPDGESIAYADIDLEHLHTIRRRMPCGRHRKVRRVDLRSTLSCES